MYHAIPDLKQQELSFSKNKNTNPLIIHPLFYYNGAQPLSVGNLKYLL